MIIIFSQRHNYINEPAFKVCTHIERATLTYYVNAEKTAFNNNTAKCTEYTQTAKADQSGQEEARKVYRTCSHTLKTIR